MGVIQSMRTNEDTMHIECRAPKELFFDNWASYPDILREIMENGPIQCEGSGAMGTYCKDCRFGTVEIDYE